MLPFPLRMRGVRQILPWTALLAAGLFISGCSLLGGAERTPSRVGGQEPAAGETVAGADDPRPRSGGGSSGGAAGSVSGNTRGVDASVLPDVQYDPSLPPDQRPLAQRKAIAVSAVAFFDDLIFERDKPVAILLIPYSNTRKDFVCETFFNSFQPYSDRPDGAPASVVFVNTDNKRVTYWLDKRDRSEGLKELREVDFADREAYCEHLIRNYDFTRAGHILANLDLAGEPGPVLYGYFNDQSHDLVFNLSKFRDDDIQRAFQIWERRVIRNPETWNQGFGWIASSEVLRTQFRQYSQNIFIIVAGSAKAAPHLK